MAVQFAQEGSKATQVFVLENNGSDKVPVQLEAVTRDIAVDGTEKRAKTEEFIIYPEQVVLLPNEKRNIRVTWTGGKVESEKAFRLIASQLPLEFHDENSKTVKNNASLKFLIQYVASVYVTPPNAAPKVKVVAVKKLKPKQIEIEMANGGNAHKVMRPKLMQIFSGEKKVLEMKEVKDLETENMLAGITRKFTVNLPQDVPDKNLSLKLELEDTQD